MSDTKTRSLASDNSSPPIYTFTLRLGMFGRELKEFTYQSFYHFRKLVQDQMHKMPGCSSQQRQPHLPGTGWKRVSSSNSKMPLSLEQFCSFCIHIIQKIPEQESDVVGKGIRYSLMGIRCSWNRDYMWLELVSGVVASRIKYWLEQE